MKKFNIECLVDGAVFLKPVIGSDKELIAVKKGEALVLDEQVISHYHFSVQALEKSGMISVLEAKEKKAKATATAPTAPSETEVNLAGGTTEAETEVESDVDPLDVEAKKALIANLTLDWTAAKTKEEKAKIKKEILDLKKEINALK